MNRIDAIRQRRAALVGQAQQLRAQVQDARRALTSQVGSSLLLAGAGRLLMGGSRFGRWAGLAFTALPILSAVLSRFRRKPDTAAPRAGRR